MGLPSRRAAMATLCGAALLGVGAALIAWQTATPRAAAPDAREVAALAAAATGDAPAVALSVATATPVLAETGNPGAEPGDEGALSLEIRKLVAAGQIGRARSKANEYYARFPNGPSEAALERLTGAHPIRGTTGTRP